MLLRRCALLVAVVALDLAINTAAQVNTPGGVRSVARLPDASYRSHSGAMASSVSAGGTAGPSDNRPDWAEDTAGAADSGQLLWQSIPSFPDTEMQALATFTGILRQGSEQQAEQSGGNRHGSTAVLRSAADEFIEALLKTTRRGVIPGLRPLYQSAHSKDAEKQDPYSSTDPTLAGSPLLDGSSESEDDQDDVEDSDQMDLDSAASTEGGSESLPEDQSVSTDLLSAAAAVATDLETDPSTQPIADTASAVEGQVLVTQAEIIPSMQHYGQVVLSSLKMRPLPAEELLARASAMHADAPAAVQAAAWQENLKQVLEAATAVETNTTVTQMHTRMTSILNLGLELAEPPVAYASAAANSVATSIKVMTGDESVLVGVSLIRLGPHAHAHNTTSTAAAGKGASAGTHVKHSPAAEATATSSMLAMLTLYGIGAPSNAVQIAQRMQEACPDLFVYGASLTNSSCGRVIISDYVAAVLAAQIADQGAHSTDAGSTAVPAPSRTLLQESRSVSFTSSSRLATRGSGGARTVATSITASANTGKLPALDVQMPTTGAPSGDSRAAAGAGGSSKGPDMQAVEQQSPEMAAFVQHSQHCLRVRQQPEVNIIITQAVGVTPGQQAGPLAAQLQLLSQGPALVELLSLSGLTLAQAGKPQVIDLSAAALAAAGLGRGGTLAAASALGSEAAALGQAWGAAAGTDSRSGTAGRYAGAGSNVAAPAVIGIAVAVAVSVMAVCAAAVAIVVVKQRAKHARAAAAGDAQQLPKNTKRRKSNKVKGVTSKYLPTSHPAILGNTRPSGIPPPPCVIVTAVNSPCQHTPGHSPCKPDHRPAPLSSAGSSALISLGSGPTGSVGIPAGTPSAYAGLLGPAVTRGDSVSSAIMAEFAEQGQQRETDDGEEDEAGSLRAGSAGEQDVELLQSGSVRGPAVLNGANSSCRGNSSPVRTLHKQQAAQSPSAASTAAAPSSSNHQDEASPLRSCSSPFHHVRQQWEARDADSRSSSSACSPMGSHAGARQDRQHSHDAAAAAGACVADGAFAAPVADGLRVFSRPLSESSLPEDLKAAAAAAGQGSSASATTAAGSRVSGTGRSCSGSIAQRSSGPPVLLTLRTLQSYNSGNPDRPGSSGLFSSGPYSSGTPAKSSPFMAYDVSVLLYAASAAAGTQSVRAVSDMNSSSVADSSLQIPQWAESCNSASIGGAAGPAGPAGFRCSDDASAMHLGAAAGQHSDCAACLQQQQQQQQDGVVQVGYTRSGGGFEGNAGITPFMQPYNVPPGFE